MSSASSAVTYTSVYTDSEPGRVFWGADEELSDGGSPRVIMYGYDGLPMLPPHDPDFMPEPIYPEYIPLEDEHVLPAEEQPLPLVVSPTAESLEYVVESDLEEDPDEYEDDEAEDGPVDYPMDGGDDGDDDDGDSSGDDADDEDEDEEDEEEEEEEEHLAPANSAVVIPTDELVSSLEGIAPAEVEKLLAMPTPSTSPLTSLSPPSAGERLARCMAPAALPPSPLPPPLHMLPPVDHKDDIPETEMPPRKRLCLSTLGSRYEVEENSTARPTEGRWIDYRDTWVDRTETVIEIAPMTVGEDSPPGDHTDCGGGGLCCTRGLGSLDRIESGSPFLASDLPGAGASGTDGRDSSSDGRHETRDARHAGQVSSTASAAEES
nr:hypothetical protein [Tanacetum cinerariifolium]